MKVGDLISFRGTLHVVVKIRAAIPNGTDAREIVVLKDTKTLGTRTVPMKWIRSSK